MDYLSPAELRLLERRLRAAFRSLRSRWTINGRIFGDAMICQDMIAKVRFERRARRQTPAWYFGPNYWGPQIDMLIRDAAKGGLCVQAA